MHAGHIDTLFGLDLAAVQHGADDVGVGDLLNVQHDQAVVQHDGAAGLHVLGQILVSDGADLLGALHLAGGQGKGLAGFQHLHTVLELLQADLGALGVQQGGNGLAQLLTQSLQLCQTAAVLLVGTVGEVETFMPFAIRSRRTSPLSVEGPRVQMIFVFLIKYLQRLRYNALYLDAAAQAGCSLAGSDCFAPAAAVYANMAVSTNHTTIHYKLLDTIAQEKSLQRNC